jgi:hypothetical protein
MGPLTVVGVCSMHPAVHRWLGTLRRHFDGRCLVFLTNPPPGTVETLAARHRADVIPVTVDPDFWAPRPRAGLCGQWEFLRDACTRYAPDGHVLRTDVWDVVFQDDPRKYVDFASPRMAISLEGFRLDSEAINRAWTARWAHQFAGSAVVNGGLVCGPARSLAVLAAVVARCPFDTPIDQSELSLLAAAFPAAFEHRRGFLECLYGTFDREGAVADGKVVFRESGQPWCVVHANVGRSKVLLDQLYPVEPFTSWPTKDAMD